MLDQLLFTRTFLLISFLAGLHILCIWYGHNVGEKVFGFEPSVGNFGLLEMPKIDNF